MKLIIALLTLLTGSNNVIVVNGQIDDTVPDYTNEQCTTWLERASEADADGSGGLSEEEFYDFLQSIETPSVAAYFENETDFQDLELVYKVAHKALACQCVYLGFGEDCCLGEDAEIPIGVIDNAKEEDATEVQEAAALFRTSVCNKIAASFGETISTTSTVAAATTEVTDAPETTEAPEETTVETTEAPPAETTEAPPAETTEAPPAETTEAPEETTTETTVTEAPSDETTVPSDETTVPSSATDTPPAAMGMELDIVGSAWNISSFEEGSVPEFWNAEEVTTNTDDNNVLGDLIKGFGTLSNQVLTEMEGVTAEGKRKNRRGLRLAAASNEEKRMLRSERQQLQPVKVTDIPCPENIAYTPPDGVTCLNFNFMIATGEMAMEDIATFEDMMNTAISDGELYDIILEDSPNTNITGLGEPGNGYDYTADTSRDPSGVEGAEPPAEDESSGGLSTAGVVFIILAVIFLPLAIVAMYSRYRKVQNEERLQKLREYQERNGSLEEVTPAAAGVYARSAPKKSGSDEGSVYSESQNESMLEQGEAPKMTAGSALAAMGAAGATAALLQKKSDDADDIKAEIRILVKETNAPKSADELLAAYAGREEELLKNLRKMKAKQDKDLAIKTEVEQLVKETNSPKSAEEMLAAYAGREDELIKNLRQMRKAQLPAEEKLKLKAEIEQLVKETEAPKSAEELLATYEGREEELAKNLRKMKGKQVKAKVIKVEIETLAKEVNAPKSAEEMMASYKGREEELLKNLQKMKAKQERAASSKKEATDYIGDIVDTAGGDDDKEAIRNEISSLVEETSPGKSAEELLIAYEGRESELVAHLKKLRKSKSKKDIV